MRRVVAMTAVALLIAACGDGAEVPGAAPPSSVEVESAASTGSGTATTTAAVPGTTTPAVTTASDSAVGLATDEPCTRRIPPDGLPPAVPLRLEDLEAMVLDAEDVGGLEGFERDWLTQGYWGNGELASLDLHPLSVCEDSEAHGRITGFANAYSRWVEGSLPGAAFAVHLFWDPEGAAAWNDAFLQGLADVVGTTDGPTSSTTTPAPSLGEGGLVLEHVSGGITWSIAMYRRGTVVGWVLDRHTAEPSLDVVAAAEAMAARTEDVLAEVAAREGPPGLDATHLISAPLPLEAYGPGYQDLAWDSVFGGCTDLEERRAISGDEEADDAQRFGRVAGCGSMYAPEGEGGDVQRVFSGVQEFTDAAGASGYLADSVEELVTQGGRTFEPGVGGAEAVGVVTPLEGDRAATDTRVVVRVGPHLLAVAVQRFDDRDVSGDVEHLAAMLVTRFERLVGHASGALPDA